MNVTIVGAGVSGLALAHCIHQNAPDVSLHCIEKSRGIGGRVATRRRNGVTFDHGAQFIRPLDTDQTTLFYQTLPHDQLVDIAAPVWTFDQHNAITPGDATQNVLPKLVYRDGINMLAKYLAPAALTVTRETLIHHIRYADGLFACFDANGTCLSQSEVLVFTPPAPQTHAILAASDIPAPMQSTLCNALAQAQYRPCLSITMAFECTVAVPYHALVNTDRAHPFSWVAFEQDKGETRVPQGQTVVTIQCGPVASRQWWDIHETQLAEVVLPLLRTLLNIDFPAPLWCDRQGWRYALPDRGADEVALQTYEQSHGVYFTGDGVVGLGRIHLAIAHGFATAQRILAHHHVQ